MVVVTIPGNKKTASITKKAAFQSELHYQKWLGASREFAQISKAASLIRQAFSPYTARFADHNLINRLKGPLHKILKTDRYHETGSRQLVKGNFSLLEGFEFNSAFPLAASMRLQPEIQVDRLNRNLYLYLPFHIPSKSYAYPEGAEMVTLFPVLAVLDLEQMRFWRIEGEESEGYFNGDPVRARQVKFSFAEAAGQVVLAGIGLSFTDRNKKQIANGLRLISVIPFT